MPFGDVTKDVTITMKMLNRLKPGVRDGKGDLKDLERQADRSSKEIDDDFKKASKGVSGSFGAMKTAGVVAFAAVAAATTAAIKIGYEFAQAAEVQRESERELADAMKIANDYTGEAHQTLLDFASARQLLTKYGDEDTLSVMANLRAYGMNADELKKAIVLTQDLATAKKMDLRAASDLIGKAFVGETGSLSRYGIILDANLDKTEKWAAVQEKVAAAYGGAAAMAAESITGQIAQMQNTLGDMAEAGGELILAKLEPYIGDIKLELDKLADIGWDKVLDDWVVMTAGLRDEVITAGVELGTEFGSAFLQAAGIGILELTEKMIRGAPQAVGEFTLDVIKELANIDYLLPPIKANMVVEGFEGPIETINEHFGVPERPVMKFGMEWDEEGFMPEFRAPARPVVDFGMEVEDPVPGMSEQHTAMLDAHAGYVEQFHQMTTDDFTLRREVLTGWLTEQQQLIADSGMSEREMQAANADAFALYEAQKTQVATDEAQARYEVYATAAAMMGGIGQGLMSEFQGTSKEMFSIGKGMAAAEATFRTYEMAVSAYNAMAAIPVIGPGLGVAAAAAATIYGMAQVSNILATKYEKKFFGGWIDGPQGIDRVPAMLTAGEYVMPAAQSARYGAELETMRAGEFPSVPGGLGSGAGRVVNLTMQYHGVTLATDDAAMMDHARAIKSFLDEADTEYSEA